jgi:hypothetical protein
MRRPLCSPWRDFAVCLALALCSLGLSGCIPNSIIPVATRSVGMSGNNVDRQLDVSFLEVGTTHREEVLEKLAVMNTGYSSPRLFWGRWFVSTSYSSNTIILDKPSRAWDANNVLVMFDENGVVTDTKLVPDNKALWSAVTADLQNAPVRDLSNPTSLDVVKPCGARVTITLAKDWMEIRVQGFVRVWWHQVNCGPRWDSPPVRISPQKVVRVSHGGKYDAAEEPINDTHQIFHETPETSTCHTLYFAENTEIGRNIHFCTDAFNLARLFQYLYQTHPGGLRWE